MPKFDRSKFFVRHSTSINTVFLVPTVLFFIVFIVLKRYYLQVSTALKPMDASTKIMQHLQLLPLGAVYRSEFNLIVIKCEIK
jgi:hypothetical protein